MFFVFIILLIVVINYDNYITLIIITLNVSFIVSLANTLKELSEVIVNSNSVRIRLIGKFIH